MICIKTCPAVLKLVTEYRPQAVIGPANLPMAGLSATRLDNYAVFRPENVMVWRVKVLQEGLHCNVTDSF